MNIFLRKINALFAGKGYQRLDVTYPNDIFLVGYPKSGNTWMRFLIGNYISNEQLGFNNIHYYVPGILENPEICKKMDPPRFMHTHATVKYFEKLSKDFKTQFPKVIFIVRDGRDVAISYYYHLIKHKRIKPDMDFSEYLRKFQNGSFYPNLSWGEYVSTWLDKLNTNKNHRLILRYEDLLQNPEYQFQRILDFTNIDFKKIKFTKAIERSSFEVLKNQEKIEQETNPNLKDTNHQIPFIRSGRSNQWETYFCNDQIEKFLQNNRESLYRLGYS
jgi:hypothetical protein